MADIHSVCVSQRGNAPGVSLSASPSAQTCRRVCVLVSIPDSEPSWRSCQSGEQGVSQQTAGFEVPPQAVETLQHGNRGDRGDSGGGGLMMSGLELGGDSLTDGSPGPAGGLRMDLTPQLEGEEAGKTEAGALEVFHPGVSADEPPSSIVVAEALRCQVKITTQRSLHLRIANHTARDVYVRLVGHAGHVADIRTGLPKKTLDQSKIWASEGAN